MKQFNRLEQGSNNNENSNSISHNIIIRLPKIELWSGLGRLVVRGITCLCCKKALEKVFTKGTDDFYEDLLDSQEEEKQRMKQRESLSCSSNTSEKNLKAIVEAQKQKQCLGCVPWGVFTLVKKLKK